MILSHPIKISLIAYRLSASNFALNSLSRSNDQVAAFNFPASFQQQNYQFGIKNLVKTLVREV